MKARSDNAMRATILANVAAVPFSGCHIWMRSCMANGYGQIGYQGRNEYAHRVAYALFKGTIPNGMSVLHRCDVRCCVNPDHLFLGEAIDNVRDMMNKGRQRFHWKPGQASYNKGKPGMRGERHPNAKLTAEQVGEIRRRYQQGQTQKQLAKAFNTSQPNVSSIIRNAIWSH